MFDSPDAHNSGAVEFKPTVTSPGEYPSVSRGGMMGMGMATSLFESPRTSGVNAGSLASLAQASLQSPGYGGSQQSVGGLGARGNRARAEHTACRPARSWIDDVPVARAIGHDELLAGAARAERDVPQSQPSQPASSPGRSHIHLPAVTSVDKRRHRASAGRDQRIANAVLPKAPGDRLHRVALADRAKVDAGSTTSEADPVGARVEVDTPPVHRLERGRDLAVPVHRALVDATDRLRRAVASLARFS